jgi:predicted nucleotidyltransferase
VLENNEIKLRFKKKINEVLELETSLKFLLYEIFVFGSAYIIGGFLRDLINGKESRDIDILVDLNHNKLIEIISESKINYEINRHNGIKLIFNSFEVDMWSIDNNWAFKNKLVKLNEKDKLKSIAKGCFYNYDSLVINLHTQNFNIQYYKDFSINSSLDILQKSSKYKNLNPTIEANILRAFYLKKLFKISYTNNTKKYLISKIGNFKDKNKNILEVLINTKHKYPKYDIILNEEEIKLYIDELIRDAEINNQFTLNI